MGMTSGELWGLGFCSFAGDREIKVFDRKVRKGIRKERKDFRS